MIKRSFNSTMFKDTVRAISEQKIYHSVSPYHGQTYFIIECEKAQIRALPWELSEDVIVTIRSGDLLDKTFLFTVIRKSSKGSLFLVGFKEVSE